MPLASIEMKIVTDNKRLRRPTDFVREGEDISEIVEALFQGLEEHNAVGLSANQLGYKKRVFVMSMKPRPPVCLVNAVIVKNRGGQVGKERCLSLPGFEVKIKRPQRITLKGLNQYFKPVKYKLSGLQARIACHEINHLDGILIIDYEEEARVDSQ